MSAEQPRLASASFTRADVLRIVRESRWLMPLCALAAVLVTLALISLSPTTYYTEGKLLLTPSANLTEEYTLIDSISQLDKPSTTAALGQLMRSESILSAARAAAGIEDGEAESYEVQAEPSAQTSIVALAVTGPDARKVDLLADAIVKRTVRSFEELYRVYAVNVIDPPDSTAETDQNILLRVAAAATLGLAVGYALALLRDLRSRLPHARGRATTSDAASATRAAPRTPDATLTS